MNDFGWLFWVIIRTIEENLIELGDMTGQFGLAVNSTDQEKYNLVLISGMFGGKNVSVKFI